MANTVVFLSDEHNPLYSSPYGCRWGSTPEMQALADEGVLYGTAYCPSPLCLPSRSAFMAGKRVHEIQAYSNCNQNLDPSPLSIGAALSRQGVHTAYIGKVDVYAHSSTLGFDEMMLPLDRKVPGDINHGRDPVTVRPDAEKRALGYGASPDAGREDRECVDRALQWLRETAPALDKPWVLIVNVVNPHFPHIALPEFWEATEAPPQPDRLADSETGRHPTMRSLRQHFQTDGFAEEHVRGLRRGYLACIAFVDQQLGRVRTALRENGQEDSTNLVYTSDHGEMLGAFGLWWKCSLLEDSARIPMIASGPDFERGVRVSTPVDLHDLQATFFALSGAEQPAGWLGTPLTGIPRNDPERVVFSEYHGHGVPGSSFMVRRGPWKYIHNSGAPCQLFNLEEDPGEERNLALGNGGLVAELETELRKICQPEEENRRAGEFINAQLASIEG